MLGQSGGTQRSDMVQGAWLDCSEEVNGRGGGVLEENYPPLWMLNGIKTGHQSEGWSWADPESSMGGAGMDR